jgi:hypothetical protein
MPSPFESSNFLDHRQAALLDAVELLVDELSLLSQQDWEKLPELKKRKTRVACRLRRIRAEAEAADGAPTPFLESLIVDLEEQLRRHLRSRIEVLDYQIVVLQDISLYLRESFHASLGRGRNRGRADDRGEA